MPFYPVSLDSLAAHGCRLVPDDDSYVDKEGELSVLLSPLVQIPPGQLLAGPAPARLMRLHSYLMGAPQERLVGQEADASIHAKDGVLLATALAANFGYQRVGAWLNWADAPARLPTRSPEGVELLDQVSKDHADEALAWEGIARMMLTHGQGFRDLTRDGQVYLLRNCGHPVGILDRAHC